MNIDKYITQLASAKSDAIKYLNLISWPQRLPEMDRPNVSVGTKQSQRNVVVPIVGGVGCVSLVGGLIVGKIGFTVLGGALMIGAFFVKKSNKPSQRVELESKIDIQKLYQSLDKLIYANVKLASDQWNSAVSAIHHRINQEILSSDMNESMKTEILSDASQEYPLLLSTMDISIQLQSLVSHEDLAGMKKALEDYQNLCIDNLNQVYEAQVREYKKLAINTLQ